MGHSADRLCEVFGVTRQEQDNFAMRSHRSAKEAYEQGLMKVSLVVGCKNPSIIQLSFRIYFQSK